MAMCFIHDLVNGLITHLYSSATRSLIETSVINFLYELSKLNKFLTGTT